MAAGLLLGIEVEKLFGIVLARRSHQNAPPHHRHNGASRRPFTFLSCPSVALPVASLWRNYYIYGTSQVCSLLPEHCRGHST